MYKILFLCHGNICRSVMAEFIFKEKLNNLGLSSKALVDSKAVSNEEIGNDIYYKAKECLNYHNIPFTRHYASKITKSDYEYYDYIYVMDHSNLYYLSKIVEDKAHKVKLLLIDKEVADPWYSRNFEKTYEDLNYGIDLIITDLFKI